MQFRIFHIILIVCSLNIASNAHSQTDSTKDKIKFFPKSIGDKNWKVLVSLDARRSFYDRTFIKVNGLRLGATFKGVHNFGNGFYWLSKSAVFKDVLEDRPDQDIENPEIHYSLGYTSVFYERVFLKTRWWEVDFPINLAVGKITGTYRDTTGQLLPFADRPFSAIIPSGQAKFYPFTWLSIRGSFGYRYVFNTVPEVKETFRTVFFGYGLSINPIELYKSIFKKDKKPKEGSDPEKNDSSIKT